MAFFAALFALLFRCPLGQHRGAPAATVGITLYTLLVGAEPAVLRAALISGMGLLASVGRRDHPLHRPERLD